MCTSVCVCVSHCIRNVFDVEWKIIHMLYMQYVEEATYEYSTPTQMPSKANSKQSMNRVWTRNGDT